MDRRLTPCNGRVAAAHLRGQVEAGKFVDGWPRRVARPVVDLLHEPNGARARQLLLGDAVTVFEDRDGWAFVQADKDGYVGYLNSTALGEARVPTHWVAVPAGHVYTEPDIKSPTLGPLVFGNALSCVAHVPKFHETADGGFVAKPHLWPVDKRFTDPVTVAQLHFGVPYLWGGNSVHGIDCSGLVQAALLACGIACPGDSDLQERVLGSRLEPEQPLQRGDLLFWAGHVAMAVDGETLIHANAHHMAVVYEPAAKAIARIRAQGDGPVTALKRLLVTDS